MLTVPHLLVGAAIGSAIPDDLAGNVLALGFGWLAHYVLDTIPHWERVIDPFGDDDFKTTLPVKKWPRRVFYQAVADVTLAFLILLAVINWQGSGLPFWRESIFWGAIGGIMPDLIDNAPFWNRFLIKLPIIRSENHFHQTVHITDQTQKHVPPYLGLATQATAIILSLWVIWH